MKTENIQSMERLSLFCHLCGIITIFLGILVIGLNLLSKEYQDAQVGIFILAVGYSFTKISSKLQSITYSEKKLF